MQLTSIVFQPDRPAISRQDMHTFRLSAALLASLIFPQALVGAENDVKNSDTISFHYEGETKRSKSKFFPSGKTDYVWGRVESDGYHYHRLRWSVYQTQSDSMRFTATLFEEADIDGGRLQTQATTELARDAPIESVQDAREFAEIALDNVKRQYFFIPSESAESLWRKQMSGFFFLGIASGRNLLKMKVDSNQGKFTEQGKVFEFRVDPETHFITELTIKRPPDPPAPPSSSKSNNPFGTPVRSLGGTTRHAFELTGPDSAKWTYESETRMAGGENVRFTTNNRVFNISNDASWPFRLDNHPENGDKITLMDQQQIAAAWQDGKIVRVYDQGIAEELATAEFQTPTSNWVPRAMGVLMATMSAFFIFRIFRTRTSEAN